MTKQEYKNYFKFASKRYIAYILITCTALFLPFVRIGGNQFFLLSFERGELHLLFAKFNVQELFLMPFVLIIFFIFIFLGIRKADRFFSNNFLSANLYPIFNFHILVSL